MQVCTWVGNSSGFVHAHHAARTLELIDLATICSTPMESDGDNGRSHVLLVQGVLPSARATGVQASLHIAHCSLFFRSRFAAHRWHAERCAMTEGSAWCSHLPPSPLLDESASMKFPTVGSKPSEQSADAMRPLLLSSSPLDTSSWARVSLTSSAWPAFTRAPGVALAAPASSWFAMATAVASLTLAASSSLSSTASTDKQLSTRGCGESEKPSPVVGVLGFEKGKPSKRCLVFVAHISVSRSISWDNETNSTDGPAGSSDAACI